MMAPNPLLSGVGGGEEGSRDMCLEEELQVFDIV